MTRSRVRDALRVVVEGEEVPGLIVYGLSRPGGWTPVAFPADAWPASPEVETSMLHGVGWQVATWEVPIIIWPTADMFSVAAHKTLVAMISGGCRVAWVGAEAVPFCDPPQLFDPACMSGGVLAWMTDNGEHACRIDPDGVLEPVTDDSLESLRTHARGLADVP